MFLESMILDVFVFSLKGIFCRGHSKRIYSHILDMGMKKSHAQRIKNLRRKEEKVLVSIPVMSELFHILLASISST